MIPGGDCKLTNSQYVRMTTLVPAGIWQSSQSSQRFGIAKPEARKFIEAAVDQVVWKMPAKPTRVGGCQTGSKLSAQELIGQRVDVWCAPVLLLHRICAPTRGSKACIHGRHSNELAVPNTASW